MALLNGAFALDLTEANSLEIFLLVKMCLGELQRFWQIQSETDFNTQEIGLASESFWGS